MHSFLNPDESDPNGISIGLAAFAQRYSSPICATHTDIQTTLRATCVAIGGICALLVGDAS